MPLPAWKVLGFDLSELAFSSFSTKSLMDKRYYLRRERVIFYQLAMMICLAAECTATYSLSKYEDQQDNIANRFGGAVKNNNIIDFQISLIVFCVLVACIFGADFFFLAQYKLRRWPGWYRKSMIGAAIITTMGIFACCVGSTVVVATQSAVIRGVSEEVARAAEEYYYRPPLQYNRWAVNIAFVVLIWVGFVPLVISTYLMIKAAAYDAKYGPEPRDAAGIQKSEESLVGTTAPINNNTTAEMTQMNTRQAAPQPTR